MHMKKLVKIANEHRAWLEKNGSRIYERDRAFLIEDLADGSAKAIKNIPQSLNTMGLYHGTLGVVQILDGDQSGWEHLSASIGYYGWGIDIRVKSYLKLRRLGEPTIGVANRAPLLACVASVSSAWTDRLVAPLRELQTDDEYLAMTKRDARQFELFVLEIFEKSRNGNDSLPAMADSPYRSLIEAWESDELQTRLLQLCDYHCDRIEQKTGNEFTPEFSYPPFDLLPCGYMLVQRVRERLHLETPVLQHPLVEMLTPPRYDIASQIDAALEAQLKRLYSVNFD